MSISNQTDKIFGTGDGTTTIFSFPFKIFNASDLVVYEIDTTQTPNVTHGPLILGTDYTVSINTVGEGGTVTFVVAPTLNWQTLLQRVEPFTQSLSLNTEGNLPARQIENQLDLMTMLCIQVNEAVSRCPQLPVTYAGSLPLTMPAPQAGLILGWDPTGSFLVNLVSTTVGTIAVPISNGNIQTITTASKVSGAALFLLGNTPAGAGTLPIANLPTGTTANKILLLNGSAKIPAVDGSLLTNVVAAVNANLNGNQFGTRVSKSINTAYQATTDGEVTAFATTNGSNGVLVGLTDGNSTPSTTVVTQSQPTNLQIGITFSVTKGNYYMVTDNIGTNIASVSVFFLPLGS